MDVVIKRSTEKFFRVRQNIELKELLQLLISNIRQGFDLIRSGYDDFCSVLGERNYILIDDNDPHMLIIKYGKSDIIQIRTETFRTQIEIVLSNKIIDQCFYSRAEEITKIKPTLQPTHYMSINGDIVKYEEEEKEL